MKALILDDGLRLSQDHPRPERKPGWAVIRVRQAGICRTDLELVQGYMDFKGVIGHEFCGHVSDCADPDWKGKRVVGEINAACGRCDWCRRGLRRHCPHRTTLGIQGLDGCIAEYCALPIHNLHPVPPDMSDDEATFIEPLSAACEILDQVQIRKNTRCIVLGDGKLGILCAWVLSTASSNVRLVGRHPDKLEKAEWGTLRTASDGEDLPAGADIVVEATGRPEGFARALSLCRPRGTIVLKSTIASRSELDLAPIVINELSVVGSRCGLFTHGLNAWETYRFPLARLIDARFPLEKAAEAIAAAGRPGALKVLIEMPALGDAAQPAN